MSLADMLRELHRHPYPYNIDLKFQPFARAYRRSQKRLQIALDESGAFHYYDTKYDDLGYFMGKSQYWRPDYEQLTANDWVVIITTEAEFRKSRYDEE